MVVRQSYEATHVDTNTKWDILSRIHPCFAAQMPAFTTAKFFQAYKHLASISADSYLRFDYPLLDSRASDAITLQRI